MIPIAWHSKALDDVSHALGFYRSQSSTLPSRFLDQIDQAIIEIQNLTSLAGSSRNHPFAGIQLKHFPYFIGYVVISGRIWILTVSFSKRGDITSWKNRAQELKNGQS